MFIYGFKFRLFIASSKDEIIFINVLTIPQIIIGRQINRLIIYK